MLCHKVSIFQLFHFINVIPKIMLLKKNLNILPIYSFFFRYKCHKPLLQDHFVQEVGTVFSAPTFFCVRM